MTTRKPAAGRPPTPRRTAAKRTPGRRTSTRRTGARRTTGTAYRRRRAQPKVATTVGAALGTVLVAFLLAASWPVRVGLVALALLLVGGYLLLQDRRTTAADAQASAPVEPPAPTGTTGSTGPTRPTTETPEDPSA